MVERERGGGETSYLKTTRLLSRLSFPVNCVSSGGKGRLGGGTGSGLPFILLKFFLGEKIKERIEGIVYPIARFCRIFTPITILSTVFIIVERES